jgi:hypothetical protein
MRERPILFSAPMVWALLAGTKTQTRRIVKLPENEPSFRGGWEPCSIGGAGIVTHAGEPATEQPCIWNQTTGKVLTCPYGGPGDRLWVKEAIRWSSTIGAREYSVFAADGRTHTAADAWPWQRKVLPGMFMPRGLSRISLDITGIRVERLHAITEDDARAEGVERYDDDGVTYYGPLNRGHACAAVAFERLWHEINGAESWKANPFVWVVSFKRAEAAARAA